MVLNFLKLINAEQAEVLHTPIRTCRRSYTESVPQFGLTNFAAQTILTPSTVKLPSKVTTRSVITIEGSHNLQDKS
jgi:hypothetical protein